MHSDYGVVGIGPNQFRSYHWFLEAPFKLTVTTILWGAIVKVINHWNFVLAKDLNSGELTKAQVQSIGCLSNNDMASASREYDVVYLSHLILA